MIDEQSSASGHDYASNRSAIGAVRKNAGQIRHVDSQIAKTQGERGGKRCQCLQVEAGEGTSINNKATRSPEISREQVQKLTPQF